MKESLDELINLLSLEQLDLNVFRAFHPEGRKGRLFGGQIMAQALMAASMTVPKDRSAHSLHGYFMRPGTPDTPALIKSRENSRWKKLYDTEDCGASTR